MNAKRRWIGFMRYWNTVMGKNYDCVGDLVEEVNDVIIRIKKNDKSPKKGGNK